MHRLYIMILALPQLRLLIQTSPAVQLKGDGGRFNWSDLAVS